MKQLQVTQFSGEELQRRFDNLENQLKDIQDNFEPKSPSEYLTRQQTADLLHVDLSTIWNWCKKKKLQPLGIGGRLLFRREDIDNAIIELKG